jgi:hypothetical protein
MGAAIRKTAEEKNVAAVQFLQNLSDDTAGRLYKADTKDLKKSFDLILDELRQQYFIGYYLDDKLTGTDLHKISVATSNPDAAVRARRYYKVKSEESEAKK